MGVILNEKNATEIKVGGIIKSGEVELKCVEDEPNRHGCFICTLRMFSKECMQYKCSGATRSDKLETHFEYIDE